jgi:hypothetical protein
MAEGAAVRRAVVAVVAVVVLVLVGIGLVRAMSDGDGSGSPLAGGSSTGVPTAPGHHHSVPSVSLGTSFTPGSGSTVPDQGVHTKRPVPLRSPAPFGTGVSVRIVRITPIQGHATEPGEVDGPALRLQLLARNASKHAVSLDSTVVFVAYGRERTPAEELASGEHRFAGPLGPRQTARATYVFQVPPGERDDVRVQVSYTGAAPTVVLEGRV